MPRLRRSINSLLTQGSRHWATGIPRFALAFREMSIPVVTLMSSGKQTMKQSKAKVAKKTLSRSARIAPVRRSDRLVKTTKPKRASLASTAADSPEWLLSQRGTVDKDFDLEF